MTTSASKRVLILELMADGHHPFHIRRLLDSGLADDAHIVLAAQPQMFKHPVIASCAVAFEPYVLELALDEYQLWNVSPIAVFHRSWTFGRIYRQAYAELSRRAPFDVVIVPYLDDCLLGLALPGRPFGGTPWLSITMRTMFHFEAMGVTAPRQRFTALRRWLTYRMLRQKSTAALLTIDPTLAQYAGSQRNRMLHKIRYVPDPATKYDPLPSKQQAQQLLGIAADARVVLVYGEISYRKGLFYLVEAAADPHCDPRLQLLLAGRNRDTRQLEANPHWQALIAQRRIHVMTGFVDDDQERLLMRAADCMWVGYINFYGVSGVMALAGRNGMPVLACNHGLIGYLATKYELGAVVEPRNIQSIVAALNRLANEPEFFARAGRNGVAVYQDHAPIEFQRRIMDTIRQSWTGTCD